MRYVDNFLNKITMYRLVLYGLFILSLVSILFGFFGILSYGGMSLIYSLVTLFSVCYFSNIIFAKIFKVQTNVESSYITALILFFITFPVEALSDLKMLIIVGILSQATKYFLAIKKKHIFNPSAVSIFILGIFGSGISAWWVGSFAMLIPVAIVGFLVLRKVRRFSLFFSFLIVAIFSIGLVGYFHGSNLIETFKQIFTSWPILFFGSIMLTEPLTTPPTRKLQMMYGSLVGVFFGMQFHLGFLYTTPELALVLGNIFSYFVSPRARLILTLIRKDKLSSDVWNFVWESNQKLNFKPGQYLEWTLGHNRPDLRGNRRYFTIASSPTEENIILGTKFYEDPSSFKKKLLSMEIPDKIIASQLSGEFTLPDDPKKKLVFIAGGIGITPFRSMAKYLTDKKDKRDITLFFSNRTSKDIIYKDIFDDAEAKSGLKTLYVVGDLAGKNPSPNVRVGLITDNLIMKEVPDYKERIFYISGPHGMVEAFKETLKKLGVSRFNIKTDFFPGLV